MKTGQAVRACREGIARDGPDLAGEDDGICDWLKLPVDHMLMITDLLIRNAVSHDCFQAGNRCSSHKLTVTIHRLDVAVTRRLIRHPPHILYAPSFLHIYT